MEHMNIQIHNFITFKNESLVFFVSLESKPTQERGGGLCSSTLEKLKGFSCMAEPFLLHVQDQKNKNDHNNKRSDERSSVSLSVGDFHQQATITPLTWNEREDDAGDNKEEEDSELAAFNRVHKIFPTM